MTSLYDLVNSKAKKSVYKSVYLNGDLIAGYPVISIETNDSYFLEKFSTKSKRKKSVEQIYKKIRKHWNEIEEYYGIEQTEYMDVTFYSGYPSWILLEKEEKHS